MRICDRCSNKENIISVKVSTETYDLCVKCYDLLIKWIKNENIKAVTDSQRASCSQITFENGNNRSSGLITQVIGHQFERPEKGPLPTNAWCQWEEKWKEWAGHKVNSQELPKDLVG